jgi:hypothetical protein
VSEVAKPGRSSVTPSPWFTKVGRVKMRFSTSRPNVSVTRATYRSPSRMLRNPMRAPRAMATNPPATMAARTGHPWWLANSAVDRAPTPAKVI